MIAAVFVMQGLGQLFAATMALIVTIAHKDSLANAMSLGTSDDSCRKSEDVMWRVVLGFGAVPACFAVYYRLTIPETPRYACDVRQDLEQAAANAARFRAGRRGSAGVNMLE